MRVLSIGDIHGSTVWEEVDPKKYDKVIFVGDYVDDWDKSNVEILHNLKNIINFSKENDNVILLIGNHDLQYMFPDPIHRCSGYRPEAYFDLNDVFKENMDQFLMAYQIDNYLWTHAGVHRGWYEYRFLPHLKGDIEGKSISEQLNEEFLRRNIALFDMGYLRGGYHDTGGPVWCDIRMSVGKPLKNYHQIVGHTKVKEIRTFKKDENTSITYIDRIHSEDYEFYDLLIT